MNSTSSTTAPRTRRSTSSDQAPRPCRSAPVRSTRVADWTRAPARRAGPRSPGRPLTRRDASSSGCPSDRCACAVGLIASGEQHRRRHGRQRRQAQLHEHDRPARKAKPIDQRQPAPAGDTSPPNSPAASSMRSAVTHEQRPHQRPILSPLAGRGEQPHAQHQRHGAQIQTQFVRVLAHDTRSQTDRVPQAAPGSADAASRCWQIAASMSVGPIRCSRCQVGIHCTAPIRHARHHGQCHSRQRRDAASPRVIARAQPEARSASSENQTYCG